MKLEHEAKVGIFAIGSVALLVFIIIWINNFTWGPQYKIYALFKDISSLTKGATVYYMGLKAGKVSDISLTQNYTRAIVSLNITNDEIKLFEGTSAYIMDKGFTGTKVVILSPPKDINNKPLLESGDIIHGKISFTFEEFQKRLSDLAEDGTLTQISKDLQKTLKYSAEVSESLDKILKKSEKLLTKDNVKQVETLLNNLYEMSKSLKTMSDSLNRLITNPNIRREVKQTVYNTSQTVEKLQQVIDKTGKLVDRSQGSLTEFDEAVGKADQFINDEEFQQNITESAEKIRSIVSQIEELQGDEELQAKLKDTLETYNCLGEELSKTLSKRFLLLRLIFGKPGANIGKCAKDDLHCILKEAEKQEIESDD